MYAFCLLLSVIATALGVFAIGFGIPNHDFSVGSTLIISGSTGVAAGIVMFGIAAAVRQLRRIADALAPRAATPAARRAAEAVEALKPHRCNADFGLKPRFRRRHFSRQAQSPLNASPIRRAQPRTSARCVSSARGPAPQPPPARGRRAARCRESARVRISSAPPARRPKPRWSRRTRRCRSRRAACRPPRWAAARRLPPAGQPPMPPEPRRRREPRPPSRARPSVPHRPTSWRV